MTKRQYILFAPPALIWGSTWVAIKFQPRTVGPLAVSYRFILARLLLALSCYFSGKNMKFRLREHSLMFLLGLSLFGINYWFVYQTETMLTSGVVAVVFSMIIFFTIFFNAVLLKRKADLILAAILGVGGTALLLKNEWGSFNFGGKNFIVFMFGLGGLISALLGNILSAHNQRKKIPVLQASAFGMLNGVFSMFLVVLVLQKPFIFDTAVTYPVSLIYPALFGSIVAFTGYLKLRGEIGPDRSVYVTIITPVIALIISTIHEGYYWDVFAFLGLILLFTGNFPAIRFNTKKALA